MGLQAIPIVPFKTGVETDSEAFLIENDAFPELNDCYVYQGRVVRRRGGKYLGRLEENYLNLAPQALGNTAASPFAGNIYAILGIAAPGIQLAIGSVIFTIAAPVGPSTYVDLTGTGVLTLGGIASGTIDYLTGDFSLTHGAGAASAVAVTFAYYTGRPVMGLRQRELDAINSEGLIAFDTVKANLWSNALRRFIDISYTTAGLIVQWTSTNSDFFWSTNYYVDGNGNKLFWATNNIQNSMAGPIPQDGIQIYNGNGWEIQTPRLNSLAANRFLNGCLLLVPYRNRMVALNTLESIVAVGAVATRYPNRARWSQNGVPYTDTLLGFQADAWYDTQAGKGGYIDAPTAEDIVSCGFFKDTLIVFFERSTWALVYTGNEVLPFIWQKVNDSFGCESTFSTVTFDKGVFAVGDKAIVVADTVNVDRIDQKIPTEVFNFHNQNSGPRRVHGIRDYYYQFVYWIFPNDDQNGIYPNKMLVLNYNEGSYSYYNDSYTCLGYYQDINDRTWATCLFPWASAPGTWSSARNQADFPAICAGNQNGFVCTIEQQIDPDRSLYVTNITQANPSVVTAPNHNLIVGQYIIIEDVRGMVAINGLVGRIVDVLSVNTFSLDINTLLYPAYTLGGTIRVLFGFEIVTKKFNPLFLQGQKCRLTYADMYLQKTTEGQITADLYTDDSYSMPIDTRLIDTTQNYGPTVKIAKIFQRVFWQLNCQFFQFKFYLSDAQMRNPLTRKSDVVIHVLNSYIQPAGRLI